MTLEQVLNGMIERFDASKATGVDAQVQMRASGEDGGDYVFTIKAGKAALSKGLAEKPVATVNVSAADWISIAMGKLDPMMAFMTGKLKVNGDIGFMMKFQGMFQQ